MKSWALGEELSTMRFTILMRVSLSFICSRGRNRGSTQPWGGDLPTPLWFCAGNREGQLLLGPPAPGAWPRHFFTL